MARIDDDCVAGTAIPPAVAATCVEEDEADGANRGDNMPIEPVVDVDEWLADEAGYGYGV